jgi:hypothetical protein
MCVVYQDMMAAGLGTKLLPSLVITFLIFWLFVLSKYLDFLMSINVQEKLL